MDGLESRLSERLEEPGEHTRYPQRVFGFFRDRVPSPGLYVELVTEEGENVPFLVHNFRYYEYGMRRWRTGVIETLVLNELHELTHWAMTEEEREDLHARSTGRGIPDGDIINPWLFEVIEWADGDYTRVYEPDPPWWRRLAWSVAGRVRRLVPWADTGGVGEETDASTEEGDTF